MNPQPVGRGQSLLFSRALTPSFTQAAGFPLCAALPSPPFPPGGTRRASRARWTVEAGQAEEKAPVAPDPGDGARHASHSGEGPASTSASRPSPTAPGPGPPAPRLLRAAHPTAGPRRRRSRPTAGPRRRRRRQGGRRPGRRPAARPPPGGAPRRPRAARRAPRRAPAPPSGKRRRVPRSAPPRAAVSALLLPPVPTQGPPGTGRTDRCGNKGARGCPGPPPPSPLPDASHQPAPAQVRSHPHPRPLKFLGGAPRTLSSTQSLSGSPPGSHILSRAPSPTDRLPPLRQHRRRLKCLIKAL